MFRWADEKEIGDLLRDLYGFTFITICQDDDRESSVRKSENRVAKAPG